MASKFGAFAAGSVLLLVTNSTTAAPAQSVSSPQDPTVGVSESAETMDLNLARQISQAWIRGQEVDAALTLQIEGEAALLQGDLQQARHFFAAAERELTVLHNP